MRYWKIPIEIEARSWTGDEACALDLADWTKDGFRRVSDGVYTAEVYDVLHDTWVKLRTGDYVIQGVHLEFYPVEASVFAATYGPA